MAQRTNRRTFLKHAAYAGATLPVAMPALVRAKSPNAKLNIAFIGTGGKGNTHVRTINALGENCLTYCDTDTEMWASAAEAWPSATGYQDYRKMFDKEHRNIDAVFVTTPDHNHFPASMIALQHDKHVYCQKPLTWSVWEARKLAEEARRHKVATQMGNQGHSGEGWRMLCEWVWSGAIGDVTEVHNWTNRPIWPQGLSRPAGKMEPPDNLNWNCWLGPAPRRPFFNEPVDPEAKKKRNHGTYHPFSWRGWFDFGAGALGDMACHTMDGMFWALEPGHPSSVEAFEINGISDEQFPNSSRIRWQFPARRHSRGINMPAFTAYWHDGGLKPDTPAELEADRSLPNTGNLFIGTKGTIMIAGDYGNSPRLIPESKNQEIGKPDQILDRAPDAYAYTGDKKLGSFEDNHHLEFILACKGERPLNSCGSNFDYAGPMTEVIQLGNVALRAGQKIEWDGPNMKVTNVPQANALINREPRKGWKVV